MATQDLGAVMDVVPVQQSGMLDSPANMEPEKILPVAVKESLSDEAKQVVSRIHDKSTRDEVLAIGMNMRVISDRSSELLKVRFREMIKDDPNRAELEGGIDRMHEAIEGLDPVRLGKLGIIQTIFTRNPLAKRIKNLVKGFETGEQKISSIEGILRKGSSFLRQDSTELIALWDNLEAQQQEFAKKAFMLSEVLANLDSLPPPGTPTEGGGAVVAVDRQFQAEVAQTVADLKLMFIVNQQFKGTIDITVNNNRALVRNVERLLTMVSITARSALALQTALLREKGVLNVTREVKHMLERTLESNARMVKENALDIAKASTDPILAIETVKQTYNSLQQTMREIEDLRSRTLLESRTALDTIDKVTADLKAMPGLRHFEEQMAEEGK